MNTSTPRIVFFGTPDICLPILDALSLHGYAPAAVITNPDRPVGRKHVLTPPPVKIWAQEKNIPVHQPEKLDDNFYAWYRNQSYDIALVVAYGKIIPERIIVTPVHGTLNIHYSLLPRWRGASPVESAILHGDTMTGVCIQKMVYELDAGDILSEIQVPIHDTDTTPTLRARLNTLGAHMLVDLLPRYIEGTVTPQPQSLAGMTKCTKIKKEDGCIDIHNLDHEHVWRMYRAYTPWPGIFFFDAMGKRVKITEMSYANNQCIIEKVIPEGKSEMSFEEWNKRNT